MADYLIIVAGGTGDRMRSVVPKQFLTLAEKPVIMHTIDQFSAWNPLLEIVLVLHPAYFDYWDELCKHHNYQTRVKLVSGGSTRFHSVQNGINSIAPESAEVIAIHDAVRPLVNHSTIDICFREARNKGSAIPVVELVDTLRAVMDGDSHVVDRGRYRAVQTPQCFEAGLLAKAYRQEYRTSFTDSASVVEALGEKVHLVEGNRDNIKLTTPSDMVIAAAILRERP